MKEEPPDAPTDLGDIVPLATQLKARVKVLEKNVQSGLVISETDNQLDKIDANLKAPADQLQEFKDSKEYKYYKLLEFREILKHETDQFKKIDALVRLAIQELGAFKKSWLKEKRQWSQWRISLLIDEETGILKSTFDTANLSIDKALGIVIPRMEAMLALQEKNRRYQFENRRVTLRIGCVDRG